MIAFEQPELFEEQLAKLSAAFVSLPADQVDQQIDWGLQVLLEAMGMDRSSLVELSDDGNRLEVTHTQVRAETHRPHGKPRRAPALVHRGPPPG